MEAESPEKEEQKLAHLVRQRLGRDLLSAGHWAPVVTDFIVFLIHPLIERVRVQDPLRVDLKHRAVRVRKLLEAMAGSRNSYRVPAAQRGLVPGVLPTVEGTRGAHLPRFLRSGSLLHRCFDLTRWDPRVVAARRDSA